ncbi:cation transporter [Nocardiopsis sp. CNT312]|uniref:cation transporter n=1 Tax=Nocardiopsis sp. CNT312 TaxID=1137268 RepID=UPI00048B63D1|nr:cation transporter [Nocardiopsis sp. CNT312]
MTAPPPTDQRRAALTRRIRLLVAATIAYNLVEAVVALSAGALASSTALIGFGLDSLIEVSSAAAVAWQFSARRPEVRQARERRALRVIAVSFFALAAYVTFDALHTLLLGGTEAAPSAVGIAVAALSVVIMPALSLAQRRTGTALGSASAVADSKQTLLCAYLSAALLVGLLANALLGWAWADPAAALFIAALALREGRRAWKGEGCCAPTGIALAVTPGTDACSCRH